MIFHSKATTTVQNLVASGDLHVRVDLNETSVVMENAMYEPEVFPGPIHRRADPKSVFLVFSTGRIVCMGAKTCEDVGVVVDRLASTVKEFGLAETL